jgi:hypothetical protein
MGSHVWSKNMYGKLKFREEYDKYYLSSFRPADIVDGKFVSGSPKIIDGPDIEYRLNAQGFRSKDFTEFDQNKPTILFGGDSFTFGDSLPENLCYPAMVYNKLNGKYDAYNIGYNGASIQQVVKNTMAFIRKYGNPSIIFLLMPIANRSIFFDADKEIFHTAFHSIEWVYENENLSLKERKRFFNGFSIEENVLKSIDLIYMLEEICNHRNIKLIWSTYSEESELYEKCNFKNFLSINEKIDNSRMNINNLDYWDIAKDDNHPGSGYHDSLSDIIVEAISSNVIGGNDGI